MTYQLQRGFGGKTGPLQECKHLVLFNGSYKNSLSAGLIKEKKKSAPPI